MQYFIILLLASIILPLGVFYIGKRTKSRFKKTLVLNIGSFFTVLLFSTVYVFSGSALAAGNEAGLQAVSGMAFLAASLSTGLGSIGAGIATASAASAALGALSENESIMGKALIFVGLAEGIAIYGLLISLMILGRV